MKETIGYPQDNKITNHNLINEKHMDMSGAIYSPPSVMVFTDSNYKEVLRFKFEDGKINIEYDKDNINEAGKVFLEFFKQYFNQNICGKQ